MIYHLDVTNFLLKQRKFKTLLNHFLLFSGSHRAISLTASKRLPVRVNTVPLAYTVYQDGKEAPAAQFYKTVSPVVIIHGLFGSKQNWTTLSKNISVRTKRQVMAIDVRNHGESGWSNDMSYELMKEDVLKLLDDLDIKTVNLMGHSLGGRIAMMVALTEPHYLSRLVIVDIPPSRVLPESETHTQFIQIMSNTQFKQGTNLSAARRVADEALKPATPVATLRQFLVSNLHIKDGVPQWRLNLLALEGNMINIINCDYPNTVFPKPVLFVVGGKSDYAGFFNSRSDHIILNQFFPKAKVTIVKDAGHWLHAEKPKEFLDIVCPFLEKKKHE